MDNFIHISERKNEYLHGSSVDYENKNKTSDINSAIQQHITKNEDNHFLLVDLGEITGQYEKWVLNLPRIIPHYAIKCNPSSAIIETLHSLGCHFDAASRNEIQQLLNLGVSPSKIVYANPCKSAEYIKYAKHNGVSLLVADSPEELKKIHLYYPECHILIRIKTDDTKSLMGFNGKFGVAVDEIQPLFELSKTLGLHISGVSFHVGSGCQDENVYETAIINCRRVFDIAREKCGINTLCIIDIGGGFPGISSANPDAVSFEKIAVVINHSIDRYFYDMPEIQYIAEPGRYFVASSHTLICEIINKKEIIVPETNEKRFIYYINDGIYGTFSGVMFDYFEFEIILYKREPMDNDNKKYNSIIFGPSCDSLDRITRGDVLLPKMSIGDIIVVRNIGAYSTASACEFNGFPRPSVKYIYGQ